ncbi:hypothetical protein Micbo1qcDRAFT_210406 [Microdochium bolleyi]|uniref:Uncharacterized protein n=1 Tax=Microdochium bolleyi TaxID=196109 RepID=A0A136IIM6_9PEZI|nr:hypothetical protein Micbo1qcDRAFT_210406 [Microdochium bolleyi]
MAAAHPALGTERASALHSVLEALLGLSEEINTDAHIARAINSWAAITAYYKASKESPTTASAQSSPPSEETISSVLEVISRATKNTPQQEAPQAISVEESRQESQQAATAVPQQKLAPQVPRPEAVPGSPFDESDPQEFYEHQTGELSNDQINDTLAKLVDQKEWNGQYQLEDVPALEEVFQVVAHTLPLHDTARPIPQPTASAEHLKKEQVSKAKRKDMDKVAKEGRASQRAVEARTSICSTRDSSRKVA